MAILIIFSVLCAYGIILNVWKSANLLATKNTSEKLTGVPVLMSLSDSTAFREEKNSGYIKYCQGSLILQPSSYKVELFFSIYNLILNISIFFVLYLIIKIIHSVIKGNPFHPKNGSRLKIISAIVIFIPLILQYSVNSMINGVIGNLSFTGITLHSEITGRSTIIVSIFSGILLFIISEVFRIGTSLKEENELTV